MFGGKKKTETRTKDRVTFVIITGCAGSGKTSLGKKIARETGWTYIDKDTVTRDFTDFILVDKGKSKSDRESDVYCNEIRPVEYQITFKVCDENLRLGNSVILTIPFIAQIQDYGKWQEMVQEYGLDLDDVVVKFVWINHDEGSEYTRVTKRNADRDGYKLQHWEEYTRGLEGITPAKEYDAYLYDNDSTSADEIYVKDVIEWIKK
jgi:predicted kinase